MQSGFECRVASLAFERERLHYTGYGDDGVGACPIAP